MKSLGLIVLAVLPRVLAAQGVTTAALQGTVIAEDDVPIEGAWVQVTHTLDGRRWDVVTRATGSYLIEGVAVGGPYRIEVTALGFAPTTAADIMLALGQRLILDFKLRPAPIELSPIFVEATADPVLNPSRNGPADIISAQRIAALPNPSRDILTLTLLSPQVARSPSSGVNPTGGVTFGGQNRLLNGFQIDGGANLDPYTGRLPGRGTLPRQIGLDALQEIQVLAAPYDVRHGGFAGGLVNAVTRSGTNSFHGSVFAYWADASLVGRNADGDRAQEFTTWQYGGTIGGPIARDRAHFFLSVDAQNGVVPEPGPLITDTVGGADMTNFGVRYASATRFQDVLQQNHGLDPGTLGPVDGRGTAADVLGKVTLQLGTNSHLELSHHYSDADRRVTLNREKGIYRLSSLGRREPSRVNASRLIWTTSPGGRWSNEVIASYLWLRDRCRPNANYPLIRTFADQGRLVAGTPATCPNALVQDAFALTDNLTAGFASHVLTIGGQMEMLNFEDGQLLDGAGWWDFRDLDSLEAGRAFHHHRTLPGPSRTGIVAFGARRLGLYVQDRWRTTPNLNVTAGLRMEVTALPDDIATYAPLQESLGIDNGRLPSGHAMWSPRLGINYHLGGVGGTFLRGGIGLFSGAPPYTWIGSAYRDDGTQQLFLNCNGSAVPLFDPLDQPLTCEGGAGPTPRLSFFDPDARLPQSLKASLGADHRLPGRIVGTLDLLYNRTVHQWYFTDANLPDAPVGFASGEENRPLYGTITSTGGPQPAYRDPTLGQVVRVSDRSGDVSVSVAVQLRKRFADRVEVTGLYAHTRARDRMSVANFQARPNLENTPLDGTLVDRRMRSSYFEIPHRLEVIAVARLPYHMRLSLLYAGASGTPYTYVIEGDANADGIGRAGAMRNDIVYVPRNRLDIALDGNGDEPGFGTPAQQDSVYGLIDGLIEAEPCLREQRGRIMARNSCRNPWFGNLNARLTKAIPTARRQSLELTVDLYNLLTLLDRRWGQARVTTLAPWVQMLRLVGYDAEGGRGIYRDVPVGVRRIQDLTSRWQAELSVRYVF